MRLKYTYQHNHFLATGWLIGRCTNCTYRIGKIYVKNSYKGTYAVHLKKRKIFCALLGFAILWNPICVAARGGDHSYGDHSSWWFIHHQTWIMSMYSFLCLISQGYLYTVLAIFIFTKFFNNPFSGVMFAGMVIVVVQPPFELVKNLTFQSKMEIFRSSNRFLAWCF